MALEDSNLELPFCITPDDAEKVKSKTFKRGEKIPIHKDLVREQYTDFYRIADDIRKPRYQKWNECWDLYDGRYDWSGKEDWQAKINIPKARGVGAKAP